MKMAILAMLLAQAAHADTPAPYYPRQFNTGQSMGAINENLLDVTGRNKDNLVPIVGDQACAPGQALTGATQKGGYIFGGSCTTIDGSTNTVFNSSVTFNGGVFGTIMPSSFTFVKPGTLVNHSPGGFGDVAIATVTLTTNGGHDLEIVVSGSAGVAADTTANVLWGVLVDGVFAFGLTSVNPAQNCATGSNSVWGNCSGTYTIQAGNAPLAGVHNFALVIWDPHSASTITYPASGVAYNGGTPAGKLGFRVTERR
jgi:hypothetical protein